MDKGLRPLLYLEPHQPSLQARYTPDIQVIKSIRDIPTLTTIQEPLHKAPHLLMPNPPIRGLHHPWGSILIQILPAVGLRCLRAHPTVSLRQILVPGQIAMATVLILIAMGTGHLQVVSTRIYFLRYEPLLQDFLL